MSAITKLRSIFDGDKGASYSNEYEVEFAAMPALVQKNLTSVGFTSATSPASQNMLFLCDEAQLPGTFAATQEIDGLYGGRLIQYPHARLYNDLRLSFIQTNECNPQKFFEAWFSAIFPEFSLNQGQEIAFNNSKRIERTNVSALNYYDDIVCNQMTITKTFKNRAANNGGKSVGYDIKNVYPYSIESVPLAYGASTLNKLRVSFRYEKHYFYKY
tara:strand:- start:160 stop:804 length:645 start_codon:yes stop_codon:yes gene_type:complete